MQVDLRLLLSNSSRSNLIRTGEQNTNSWKISKKGETGFKSLQVNCREITQVTEMPNMKKF